MVFLLLLPGIGIPGKPEWTRELPSQGAWVKQCVQTPPWAVMDEGPRAGGTRLLLYGMSSPRVTGRACPAICWLVGRSSHARPCSTVSARSRQRGAAPLPRHHVDATWVLQLVRQGRIKGCYVPASFLRVFSPLSCQVLCCCFSDAVSLWGLVVCRSMPKPVRWRRQEEPPAKQQPHGSQEGQSSTGSREGCSLAGGCACCRRFVIDSLGTGCKCNSPFSQSKPQHLQHSPGKAVLCFRKLLWGGIH